MLDYERKMQAGGYKLIAGMDEAGRGPLAGPVFMAMCIMPIFDGEIIDGVNDSKQLSPKQRDGLFDTIKQKAISYAIVSIDEKTIDKINILEATKFGMQKCLERISIKPDFVLCDYVSNLKLNVPFLTIKKGDALSYNIACASILAKVSRDRYMDNLDKKCPLYNFKKHKGYGTKEHYEMLKKYGISEYHRQSFLKNLQEHFWYGWYDKKQKGV